VETAEKANDGHALNAGLEQVGRRVLWEILFQNATRHHQIRIDPINGRIL
jgi:hypothetical protein